MSKFDGLRAATNARKRKSPLKRQRATSTSETAPAEEKRGRPKGKRTDENYVQTSIYLQKVTLKAAHRALDDEDKKQDFSELVESLVSQWLNGKGKVRT